MLERVREALDFVVRKAERSRLVAPGGDGTLDLAENECRARRREPEVSRGAHERLNGRGGSGVLADPGLEFADAVRERVHIERLRARAPSTKWRSSTGRFRTDRLGLPQQKWLSRGADGAYWTSSGKTLRRSRPALSW